MHFAVLSSVLLIHAGERTFWNVFCHEFATAPSAVEIFIAGYIVPVADLWRSLAGRCRRSNFLNKHHDSQSTVIAAEDGLL